jgi:hypothetical protein
METDAAVRVPLRLRQSELFGPAMLEVPGQMDAIVGGPRLLGERHDLELVVLVEVQQALAEAMSHHAIADNHYRLYSITAHAQYLPTAIGIWPNETKQHLSKSSTEAAHEQR